MASRGRGRGKDLGVVPHKMRMVGKTHSQGERPQADRTGTSPGRSEAVNPSFKIPANVDELSKYLRSLNESNFEAYVGAFADMVLGYASNGQRLKEAMNLIFDTTLCSTRDDTAFGARVCERIAVVPKGSNEPEEKSAKRAQFRKVLLGRFQAEFLKKEETRSRSIETWLCIFSFLCEVYVRIKVSDQPVTVVGNAILKTMKYLLDIEDADEDEIDCVCSCLKICGYHLDGQASGEVEKLIRQLRVRAINRKTSCRIRCLIMEVLEVRQAGWKDPGRALENFYVDALADAVAEDELRDSD